ncbi:MAG: hypothetical protein ACRDZY_14430 [Acidimicrobiales bacterium]
MSDHPTITGARRYRGRRQRVPGGYPFKVEIRLTEAEAVRLIMAAVRAEKSDGAYGGDLLGRALFGEFGELPTTWTDVMAELIEARTATAELAAEVKRVGRNVNELAHWANVHRASPGEARLAALRKDVDGLAARLVAHVRGLDDLATAARDKL